MSVLAEQEAGATRSQDRLGGVGSHSEHVTFARFWWRLTRCLHRIPHIWGLRTAGLRTG